MPIFKYTVLDSKGAETSDQITAGTAAEAAASLRRQGKFVVAIKEAAAGGLAEGSGLNKSVDFQAFNPLNHVSQKDVVLMFRQFAVLLDSGVSLVQALNILERQAHKGGLKRLIQRLSIKIESGESLSNAMSANRRVFSQYMVSMVKAAEVSGELDTVMTQVADQLEGSMEFRRQMITSLIYPALVVVMAVVAVAVLALVVIPKFLPMLHGAGKNLPWATQVVIDVTKWTQTWAKTVFMGVAGFMTVIPLIKKTDEGGYLIDWILLKIPVVGRALQCGLVVDFSRNLATLFSSGVPITDALKTVRGTIRNHVGAKVVSNMVRVVEEGESMSVPLREAKGVFPPMVAEMVATGEETGEMEKVLLLTAKIFEKMLETYVKRMNALIEPLLIVFLGGVVGFVFYALISGILTIYGV
ncbi:MAG: type II secretion system F family protein [Desulfuromonadales bacterium]|nr:type II secretion system F family protein [Desulfuromonadales bacterium]